MNQVKQNCLSCKYIKLLDTHAGVCKVNRGRIGEQDYPAKNKDDSCSLWHDCGQHYYIRTGWIKSQLVAESQ